MPVKPDNRGRHPANRTPPRELPDIPPARRDRLLRAAFDVFSVLDAAGLRGPDGVAAMGMALGIYLEDQRGAHRGVMPVAEAMCQAAQACFDAFRQKRLREAAGAEGCAAGHA